MKKIILLSLCVLAVLTLQGCAVYGTGETTGYFYAVDDGIIWDYVYYKSSLESSETDFYILREDDLLKTELRNLPPNTFVKFYYNRHFITLGYSNDEITSYEILDK